MRDYDHYDPRLWKHEDSGDLIEVFKYFLKYLKCLRMLVKIYFSIVTIWFVWT